MQWLADPGPRRPPVAPLIVTSVTQGCQVIRCAGLVRNSHATCGGAFVGTDTVRMESSRVDPDTAPLLFLLPAAPEVYTQAGTSPIRS